MKCPKCGFDNSDNSKFCINCATNLISSDKKICPNCKAENPNIAKFCYNCATSLGLEDISSQRTNNFTITNHDHEEDLRGELERLRLRSQIYPEKKKSNKKWIAIGIILLFVIALPSSYLIWFRSFQTQSQQSIQSGSNSPVFNSYMKSGFESISNTYNNAGNSISIKQPETVDEMLNTMTTIKSSLDYAKIQFKEAGKYGQSYQKTEAQQAYESAETLSEAYGTYIDLLKLVKQKGYYYLNQVPNVDSITGASYYLNKIDSMSTNVDYSVRELESIGIKYGYTLIDPFFRSFQTQTQGAVQEQASGALGSEVQVLNIANDNNNYYISIRNSSSSSKNITSVSINGTPASFSSNKNPISPGTSSTLTITPAIAPKRGTTRTFTIQYSGGSVVHTYTDS